MALLIVATVTISKCGISGKRFYEACIAGVSGEGRGVGKTEWGEGNGAFSPQPPFSSPLPLPLAPATQAKVYVTKFFSNFAKAVPDTFSIVKLFGCCHGNIVKN